MKAAGKDPDNSSTYELMTAVESSQVKILGMIFLMREDKSRNEKPVEDLANGLMKKTNNYPNTRLESYNYLVSFVGAQRQPRRHFMDNNKAIIFPILAKTRRRNSPTPRASILDNRDTMPKQFPSKKVDTRSYHDPGKNKKES